MTPRRKRAAIALIVMALFLFPAPLSARPLERAEVPEPLRPWIPWVLHGREESACPFLHDDGGSRICAWPSTLELDLKGDGGSFAQAWEVHLEGPAQLPGGQALWPEEVSVDGRPASVTSRQDVPVVRLAPGRHTVRGRFRWNELPESLPVPEASGLVTLVVDGARIPLPVFDGPGRLWLSRRSRESALEERLELEVSRHVRDSIPLVMTTRVRLRVSGAAREVVLPGVVAKGFVPLALRSALPARVEPDGGLRVQIRPGDWSVELAARHEGPVASLRLEPLPPPWPAEELWAFEAMNHLRVVEIGGDAVAVDPAQTGLPDAWKRFPVYVLHAGGELALKEVRRGDPDPVPDRLELDRTIWLAMDGSGYTFRDRITGLKHTGWRLEAGEPLELGRAVVSGVEQLITRREGSGRAGIELRQGAVDLTAESTAAGRGERLPAVGWEQDFAKARGTLHLPPGWRILNLSGADWVSNTWIANWTLLDLFLVLIFSLAIGRLWSVGAGLLALATLVLTYHEPGSPRWVWAFFLAASALVRVLPGGRFRNAVGAGLNLAVLALAAIVVPYTVREARDGIFPQLERPTARRGIPLPGGRSAGVMPEQLASNVGGEAVQVLEGELRKEAQQAAGGAYDAQSSRWGYSDTLALRPKAKALLQNDPSAAIQTGRGLPEWQWRTVQFAWNGPVKRSETLALILVGPKANLALSFLRLVLLYALVLVVLNVRFRRGGGLDLRQIRLHRFTAAALLAAFLIAGAAANAAAETPDKEILQELQQRLLAPDECLPACADVPFMRLTASPSRLEIDLELHAASDVAVPLPSSPEQWVPGAISVDGQPARGVMRRGGVLWLLARKGISQVRLGGPLHRLASLQLPLPLRPHRAVASVKGWVLEGVHADGKVEGQLQLTRIPGDGGSGPESLQAGPLPPFAQVERTLNLGLDWEVETVVRRFGPPGLAVLLEVPLLEGEAVAREGVRTLDGRVLVNMGPSEDTFAWSSILRVSPRIVLEAARTEGWTEVWRLNASPIWHVQAGGIPVIHHQAEGRWLPEWRPWPGETVTLEVSRPGAVAGQTVTIDKSHLRIDPGRRATDAHLTFTLRASQGGRHAITLPPEAVLLEVKLDGKSQPIRKEGDLLPLPTSPGSQVIDISWRVPEGMRGLFRPEQPSLGIPSVNARVEMTVPRDRWVFMTGGPLLGPAVQWWGVLAVITILALLLGRIPQMPLGTVSWFLLGVGLSQAELPYALLVAGWLIVLRLRRSLDPGIKPGTYNLIQVWTAVLTAGAVIALVATISGGLLGYPDLHIAGNGSSASNLRWYRDASAASLPAVWILSAPMFVYRLIMLAWSLWISFALLRWFRYGWESFTTGGLWRKVELKPLRWSRKERGAGETESPDRPSEP